MMKLALLMLLLAGSASVTLTPQENRQLDMLVDENILFEYDAIPPEDTSDIISASFIGVKIYHLFDKDCSSKADCGYTDHKVLKSGDALIELTSTDVLLPYIAPTFKLESEAEAKRFEIMLDALFPAFFSSGKEIYQEDNTWVFIREDSFGEKNGVKVEVDSQGVILNIYDAVAIQRNAQFEENGEVER